MMGEVLQHRLVESSGPVDGVLKGEGLTRGVPCRRPEPARELRLAQRHHHEAVTPPQALELVRIYHREVGIDVDRHAELRQQQGHHLAGRGRLGIDDDRLEVSGAPDVHDVARARRADTTTATEFPNSASSGRPSFQ